MASHEMQDAMETVRRREDMLHVNASLVPRPSPRWNVPPLPYGLANIPALDWSRPLFMELISVVKLNSPKSLAYLRTMITARDALGFMMQS